MKYGIKQSVWGQLNDVFKRYKDVRAVYLYGSRARGDFKKTSDLDLAVCFTQTPNSLSRIKWDLGLLNILHKIDILDYDKIDQPHLKAEIDNCKKKIYP